MFVRQMLVSDVDRVYDIACMSLDEGYVKEVFYLFMSEWPAGQLVAVDEMGEVRGFLSGSRPMRDRASVALFAVDPGYRRKGIGSMLMEEFRIRAMMDFKQYIQIEVRETNAAGVSFYKKMGFAVVEHLGGFYNNGGNAVRMIRSVHGNS